MQRRDFTVNALWYDPVTEIVHDAVGGIDDLERGVLRTVGEPEERFSEDYLRMLRAVRFVSRLRFRLDPGGRTRDPPSRREVRRTHRGAAAPRLSRC